VYEKIGLQFVKRKVFFSSIVVELIVITKDETLIAVTYVTCVNMSVFDAFFFLISMDAGVPFFLLHYSWDFHRISQINIIVMILCI